MSTHIEAKQGEIADKVLLPGDPLRAKHIAETFLENVICYTKVRGMYGFTGTYQGKRVSVQGTGMGMPSMHIYASELMTDYGVKNLIRVGTCGSIRENLKLRTVVLALSATTDSNMNRDRFGSISFAPAATFQLLSRAHALAQEKEIPVVVGGVFTSDKFYDDALMDKIKLLASYGILAVDMETCELYTLAAKHHTNALTIMTVSDHIVTGETSSSQERQTCFNDMVKIALETV